jgi:uncharacterized membrane protein YccC
MFDRLVCSLARGTVGRLTYTSAKMLGTNPALPSASVLAGRLQSALANATPPLLFGLRLWASVCLALYVAFWLELDNPFWAGTSAAIVCQPQLGASLRKGWYRLLGTLVGAVMSVLMTACLPQDRALFLLSLALWGALCTLVATLLRNFASYAAALAGYTAAIIAADQLGATGGLNGEAFILAVYRASEISIGIVSAGIVLAGTDLGSAPRRLAALFAELGAQITSGFVGTLAIAGAGFLDVQTVRREFVRRVIALDPVIDLSLGESSRLRYHSPVLQQAVDGLFAALAAWRALANHFDQLPDPQARREADVVLQGLSPQLQASLDQSDPGRWMGDPTGLRQECEAAVLRLRALPVATPSLRLIADQTAATLAGIADALNGLALLVADRARTLPRRATVRLRVPDWLPALVNAARSFVVIGAMALFWIVTVWPHGAFAMLFASITVILLAPRGDQAYLITVGFTLGTLVSAIGAGIIGYAVLPTLPNQSFAEFALAIGAFLVPAAALMAQPWQVGLFTAMTANFIPLLAPSNPMTYDLIQFYNQALAIVVGCGVGAMAFRLLPPLSPAFRTRRLLALTSRDLRRLAAGRRPGDWEGHIQGRLSVMPDEATPLQRAQLLAALSVGQEILQLRPLAARFGCSADLDAALGALARGDSATAVSGLARLDGALADSAASDASAMRGRANILALREVLAQHAAYFDAGPVL